MTQNSDERYAHLLQPIRDLAANWSVNIANELEDYLELLEGVQFSFAEGGLSLNFAEAALLIQGSACIYSKKVEYLHTLVYQALELISERRQRDNRSQKGGEGDGGIAGQPDDDDFDDEEQFLSLDDTLEEGTGIDLDDEAAVQVPVAMRPPATLLALEDTGNSHGDGDAGNYRIASCAVHRSGALLLEQRDGNHLDDDLQPLSSEVGGGQQAPYWAPTAVAQPSEGMATDQQTQDVRGDVAWGGFDNDDDDYDGGFDDYGGASFMDTDAEGLVAEGRQGTANPQPAQQQQQQQQEEFDPYKPLDPNCRGTLKPKPFKKVVRVARKPRLRQQQRRAPQVLDALLTVQLPASGLLFPEFAYALKQQQETARPSQHDQHGGSRATSQKSAQTATAFTYEEAVAGFPPADGEEDDSGNFYGAGDMGFDDDDDYAPVGDFAMPDMAAPAAAAALDTHWCGDAADPDELTYEELCRAHIEAFINAAAAAEVQSELAGRVSGWRSKMAPMLEEEDARPEFDIYVYGERILQRMVDLTCSDDVSPEVMRCGELQPVTFAQIVGLGLKYEASRFFSSLLQLINNGNVRIMKTGGDEVEGFTLTLLDRVLPHKKVTDYRARGVAASQLGVVKAAAASAALTADPGPNDDQEENQGMQQQKLTSRVAKGGGNKAKKQKE